jgi:hypothetical protein
MDHYAGRVEGIHSRSVLGSILVAVVVAVNCACGGDTTPPTVSPAPDLSALATQYRALAEQLGTATEVFDNGLAALPTTATAADAAAIASPYAVALHTYDSDLLRLRVSASMEIHVQTLVTADAALEKDLNGVTEVTGFSVPVWSNQITPDADRVVAASNIVRADFGLQPL